MSSSPSIYISHAWGGESEIITQQIVERFKKENLNITLDKNDLGYRESITKFMENLGQADAIILVISNKYLHSEYCMFELLQIYDNKNILERIFPVVLDEVSIAKSTDRLELVKYWENQSTELETKIRELQSLGHIDGITDDLNLYYNIRNKIAKLTSILKDINTLNVGTHRDSDFSHLVSAVKKQIANKDTSTSETDIPTINTALKTSEDIKVEDPSKKKVTDQNGDNTKLNTVFKYLVIAALFLPVGFLLKSLNDNNESGAKSQLADKVELVKPNPVPNDSQNYKALLEHDGSEVEKDNIQTVVQQKSNSLKESEPTQYIKPAQPTKDAPGNTVETKMALPESKEVTENAILEAPDKNREVLKEYNVPFQYIEVKFTEDLSSNHLSKGQTVYIENVNPILYGSKIIIPKSAQVKCLIKDAISSNNGSVGLLSLQIESVKAVNNEWIPLQYPVYSLKKRAEIVFKKGQTISKVKLPSFKIAIN